MWTYNYELSHHGIKGMKWGVRRTEAQLARARGRAERKGWSKDASEVAGIKTKSVKEMSNAELRKMNERIQLEQQYSRLNPSAIKKGFAFVAGTAVVMETALKVYNNSDRLIKIGKQFKGKLHNWANS